MAPDDGVLAAARAIRPYLAGLVGPGAAPLDRRIADLLNGPPGQTGVTVRLRALLEADADTSWFLAEVLRDAPDYRPPYHQPRYSRRAEGATLPAGDPGPILPVAAYGCPHGDYDWFMPEVGAPVPDCPTHGIPLDRI